MRDVAERAGVSAQTVSRALSGHPNVTEETRQRVREASRELGYRRSITARALVTGRSRLLGVVTLATGFYSRLTLMSGIESAATGLGYSVLFASIDTLDSESLEQAMTRLHHQGVDAVITAVPLRDPSETLRGLMEMVPLVSVDECSLTDDDGVAIDQYAAAKLATEHLLDLGHATVEHVAGPVDWIDAQARVDGWRAALQARSAAVPRLRRGDWSAATGYAEGLRIAESVRSSSTPPTAVLVSSDEMAFGVVRALIEAGLEVPADVSVVGIDDIELAAYCSPPLTTVRQSFAETATRAVRRVVSMLANDQPVPDEAGPVVPTLVVRASTAAPRH